MEKTSKRQKISVKELTLTAFFAALITVCAWISIPVGDVPITLQTFAVLVSVAVLGGKLGTLAVTVYILMGAVGLPVFANFKGGLGALTSNTGGYILGFLLAALIMWLFEYLFKRKDLFVIISMILGLIVCYVFGTAWFMILYMSRTGAVSLVTVLGWCVFPFIIPDICKIALAFVLSKLLRKYAHLNLQ